MIRFSTGDILSTPQEAITNAVNTVGVMGKGLALQFRRRFPANYEHYVASCREGSVSVGKMLVTQLPGDLPPRWIINFPTKQDWRHPSRLDWIELGLHDLRCVLVTEKIRSVALPKLGCGLGGLNWQDVRALILAVLGDLDDIEIVVYE